MKPIKLSDGTRVLGEEQGYVPLPIHDYVRKDGTPAMASLWEPSPEELKALNEGGAIRLDVLGTQHPPVILRAVFLPDTDE